MISHSNEQDQKKIRDDPSVQLLVHGCFRTLCQAAGQRLSGDHRLTLIFSP
jgi:hypothetical protein